MFRYFPTRYGGNLAVDLALEMGGGNSLKNDWRE